MDHAMSALCCKGITLQSNYRKNDYFVIFQGKINWVPQHDPQHEHLISKSVIKTRWVIKRLHSI